MTFAEFKEEFVNTLAGIVLREITRTGHPIALDDVYYITGDENDVNEARYFNSAMLSLAREGWLLRLETSDLKEYTFLPSSILWERVETMKPEFPPENKGGRFSVVVDNTKD